MFLQKNKHHIISFFWSAFLCILFTIICFISTYNVCFIRLLEFSTSASHNSDMTPQANTDFFVAYNDVNVSETSFTVNGSDPYVVFFISNTGSYTGSSPLGTRITFNQTYKHDVKLTVYYCIDEDIAFDKIQTINLTLIANTKTVYLALPNNITYLRLDINNASKEMGNTFCISEIQFENVSIYDILYHFLLYTKYVLILGYLFIILAVFYVRKAETTAYTKRILVVCYIAFMLVFISKIFIYARSIGSTPDEGSHNAYLVYETEHMTEFIPHFENMCDAYRMESEGLYSSGTHTGNYLGHPPLYYRLLSFLGIVKIIEPGKSAYINTQYLYAVNIVMVCMGMLLFLYIGYSRISHDKKYIPFHVLYLAICTSLPMIAFEAAGCTNDNLLYIEFGLFLLGIIRYLENKRTGMTYFLVCIGMCTALLTKLNCGCVMVFMVLILFIFDCIQTKSIRMIANRYFYMTLLIYMIPAIYFLLIYRRYGTIQPLLKNINPDLYYQSNLYISPADRNPRPSRELFSSSIRTLCSTWSGYYNGQVFLTKPFLSFYQLPFILFVLIAVAGGIYSLFRYFSKQRRKEYLFGVTASFGLILTFLYNSFFAQRSYINAGVLDGMQGRYYMFALPIMAFLNLIIYRDILLSNISVKIKIGISTWIMLFVIWLLVSDLPYTLTTFPNWFI